MGASTEFRCSAVPLGAWNGYVDDVAQALFAPEVNDVVGCRFHRDATGPHAGRKRSGKVVLERNLAQGEESGLIPRRWDPVDRALGLEYGVVLKDPRLQVIPTGQPGGDILIHSPMPATTIDVREEPHVTTQGDRVTHVEGPRRLTSAAVVKQGRGLGTQNGRPTRELEPFWTNAAVTHDVFHLAAVTRYKIRRNDVRGPERRQRKSFHVVSPVSSLYQDSRLLAKLRRFVLHTSGSDANVPTQETRV